MINTQWVLKESEKIYTVISVKNDNFTQDWVQLDSLFNGWDLISRPEFLQKFKQIKSNLIDSEGWVNLEDAFPSKPGLYKIKVTVGAFRTSHYESEEELSFDEAGNVLGFIKYKGDWHAVSHWKPLDFKD